MNILLDVQDVCYRKDGHNALTHVDFHLFRGEMLCIYGTFHSGINALSDILAGTALPDSGRIYYQGRKLDAGEYPLSFISRINKESSLIDNFTVAENLLVLGRGKRAIVNWRKMFVQADRILSDTLPEVRANQKVSELNSVEKRIIEIIKYAIMGVRVVLIDNVVYFSENANEQLYEIIRKFCERGMSFIYLGQKYDYFSDKADRILSLRENHLAGCLISSERSPNRLNRLIAMKNDAELAEQDDGEYVTKNVLLEYTFKNRGKDIRGSIRENEVVCFFSINTVCDLLGDTFRKMLSLRETEGAASDGECEWAFRKTERYEIALVPYDDKKDVVCRELSVYENTYLNHHTMDLSSRREINFNKRGYFSRQIDAFLGKPGGYALRTEAGKLTFQEQRLILLYRAILSGKRMVVLLYPTGDIDRLIYTLKKNHVTVLIITDQFQFSENLIDRVLEMNA